MFSVIAGTELPFTLPNNETAQRPFSFTTIDSVSLLHLKYVTNK